MKKEKGEIISIDKEVITKDTKLNDFLVRKFAQNFIDSEGDAKKAFALTFPEYLKVDEAKAQALASHPDIRKEIEKYLPTDVQIANLIKRAIKAPPKDPTIAWGDKHKFMESALKIKGLLNNDSGNKVQVNIGMVVKENENTV